MKKQTFSASIVMLLAASCGLIVANLYYAQPLVALISKDLNMAPAAAGLLVTMSQAGYGLGLLFVVPTGDMFESRKLIIAITSLGIISLLGAAFAQNSAQFIAASLLIGIGSVAVQIIIPYAAGIAPQEIQGRVVGYVMSGLLLGVMLARPLASIVTELTSWHYIFVISAVILTLLMAVLYKMMPERKPTATMSYGALLSSMGKMFLTMPVLRRRAVYQAALFSAFSLFWTVVPMYFMGDAYGMTQGHIAIFGLVGAAGVIAAPIGGRIADKGVTKFKSAMAILTAAFGLFLPHLAGGRGTAEVLLLAACAVVLDFGAIASQVMGQRVIFSLGAQYRSRVNGVYMAAFFAGGAAGSALGGYVYASYGFYAAMWTGFALPVLAFLYLLTEPKGLYAKKDI